MVACRFRARSISCNCEDEFWILATVPPTPDPCEDYPSQQKVFQRTCPFDPITADQIVAGAGGSWGTGATLKNVVAGGTNPAQGTIDFNLNDFSYTPAIGESGSTITFTVTVSPPDPDDECEIVFDVVVVLADYCADFFINDVGP